MFTKLLAVGLSILLGLGAVGCSSDSVNSDCNHSNYINQYVNGQIQCPNPDTNVQTYATKKMNEFIETLNDNLKINNVYKSGNEINCTVYCTDCTKKVGLLTYNNSNNKLSYQLSDDYSEVVKKHVNKDGEFVLGSGENSKKETKKETPKKETKKETTKKESKKEATKKETPKKESKKATPKKETTKKETTKTTKGQCYDCGNYYPVSKMSYDGSRYHCGCLVGNCENCGTSIFKKDADVPDKYKVVYYKDCKFCKECYNIIKQEEQEEPTGYSYDELVSIGRQWIESNLGSGLDASSGAEMSDGKLLIDVFDSNYETTGRDYYLGYIYVYQSNGSVEWHPAVDGHPDDMN